MIFLFNVIAALIFPTLGGVLGLSNEGFGLFAGTAVNDTSSVTAAAAAWDGMHPGANTLDTAAIVKMTRTLAIICLLYTSGLHRRQHRTLPRLRQMDRRVGRRLQRQAPPDPGGFLPVLAAVDGHPDHPGPLQPLLRKAAGTGQQLQKHRLTRCV